MSVHRNRVPGLPDKSDLKRKRNLIPTNPMYACSYRPQSNIPVKTEVDLEAIVKPTMENKPIKENKSHNIKKVKEEPRLNYSSISLDVIAKITGNTKVSYNKWGMNDMALTKGFKSERSIPSHPTFSRSSLALNSEDSPVLNYGKAENMNLASITNVKQEPHRKLDHQKKSKFASHLLSDEQQRILDIATTSKQSIFFTGDAGTGKTFLLIEIIKKLKHLHPLGTVFVTAPTGLAACNINGTTIHGFAGLGLCNGTPHVLSQIVVRNGTLKKKWTTARVLVIDEVSMLDPDFLDTLDQVARIVRRNEKVAFGGIQIIFCGDFMQLPPGFVKLT